MTIFSREIIRKDIEFRSFFDDDVLYYDDISKLVNKYKRTMLNYGAQKGDIVAIVSRSMLAKDVAQIIACLELGLIIINADVPCSELSLPYCKLNLLGPCRFHLFDLPDHESSNIQYRMCVMYGGEMIKDFSDDDSYCETPWEVLPDDVALLTSTSGSTSWAKRATFSQEQVVEFAYRNAKGLKFEEEYCNIHLKNLHHAGAFLLSILPSLVGSRYHVGGLMPGFRYKYQDEDNVKDYMNVYNKIFEYEKERKVCLLSYQNTSPDIFMQAVGERKFENGIRLMILAFPYSKELDLWAKDTGVEIFTIYGSNYPSLTPFTTLTYDGSGRHPENCIGTIIDNYYEPVIKDNRVEGVIIKGKYQAIPDHLIIDDEGLVYFQHREDYDIDPSLFETIEQYREKYSYSLVKNPDTEEMYLALFWDDDNKDKLYETNLFDEILVIEPNNFKKDLKMNFDQLRGHFIEYAKLPKHEQEKY